MRAEWAPRKWAIPSWRLYEPVAKMSRPAEVLSTHTPQLFAAALKRAADLLVQGELVALPTETVYGLAANALNSTAVARIYEVKGRPASNPIIVHVAGLEMARRCAASWPAIADRLARSFWPGPLTLVLPRAGIIPDQVTAGGSTVGIRWPSHPFMQAVIRVCGFPLAAPSANPANELSPTTAEHVRNGLGTKIGLIVDGGPAHVGIESTVLDLTVSPPRVLRPGMIHDPALLAVTGELVPAGEGQEPVLKSPGLLPKHYAPKARLELLSWRDEDELLAKAARLGGALGQTHVIAHSKIPSGAGLGRVSVIPHDAEAFARAIYAELHQCDAAGADLIVVEALPDTPEWAGLADRLKRAAAS